MYVVPVQPNKVEVKMIHTGCYKSEFDSTYSVHLNGIISPYEFQQSIENINRAILSRIYLLICGLLFITCIVGGIILFIVGGSTSGNSSHGFPPLIGVGIALVFFGMIVLIAGNCIIRIKGTNRMRQAVAHESMKYSTRSPIPCSWRLASLRIGGRYQRRQTTIIYYIVIDIGHAGAPGIGNVPYQFNQGVIQPTPYFPQQNQIPPRPPYVAQPAAGFCSQCGMPRQNPIAKFCPSCGQPFNIY